MKIKDAGHPLAVQEDSILFFRVRSGRIQLTFPLKDMVIHGRGRGSGHDGVPEILHLMAFGEEAVTADIHAIAGKVNGSGKTAHHAVLFQNHGMDVCMLQKFISRRQPCRAGADNYSSFSH